MTPTIAQGSIVVSESERVGDLRPGDVITRPAEGQAEPVTHRLVSATRQGDDYLMQTQGDANSSGESWTIPADTTLQRVRWVIPSVGDVVALLRSNLAIVLGAVLVSGLLVLAVRSPARRTHGAASGTRPTPA
jgi:signal peptidase